MRNWRHERTQRTRSGNYGVGKDFADGAVPAAIADASKD